MVLTAWVINLRFTMYSATLAPYLQKEPLLRKAPFAYILSDQAFGVTMSRFANKLPANPAWYYYGAVAAIWVTWKSARLPGLCLGTLVPESWGLDFAFPLSFMALMFAALKDRPAVVAALVGGTSAILAKGLPYNLGLVLAALLGIGAGILAENISAKKIGRSRPMNGFSIWLLFVAIGSGNLCLTLFLHLLVRQNGNARLAAPRTALCACFRFSGIGLPRADLPQRSA